MVGGGFGIFNQGCSSPVESGKIKVDLTRTPTYCEICFWKCAGWIYKTGDGKIWKITGNDEDQHCNGRFCPRGTGGIGMYNDGDRLKTPMIRTSERGKQEYREASWEEALDYIAGKMNKIALEHGPECIALLTHGSGGKYFGDLLKAFGSASIAAPSYSQCRGPREVAFFSTFGEGVMSPERTDIRDTKCLPVFRTGHPNRCNYLIFKQGFSNLGAAKLILWYLLGKTKIVAAVTASR